MYKIAMALDAGLLSYLPVAWFNLNRLVEVTGRKGP